MADARTMKRGDTWPPLKGGAFDQNGIVDLTSAASLRVLIRSSDWLISGVGAVLSPPETDSNGDQFNWQYVWAAGDTAHVGVYDVELEVTWSAGVIETFPNTGGPRLTIEQDNG